ncbi:MAG TPA: hypothetical protein PLC89_11240 [Haliscomenobacter sp.]|uniref:hypothetical protein n=1 Tax=Haliscomenobacter sp. TaxID=2717303 RepID=UPI002C8D35D4|nr:hypothetical protein [Haliscomenobacter sp.]HOY17865.1 hypothetical protein [Haliscomenobacter sp.]HPH18149.1 hypothetical protein [Haliscomenobacter sp.]
MPFAKCPNCGQSFHLHIKGVPVWPDEPNEEKEMLCPGCWIDPQVGHQVYFIREKPIKFDPEDLGVVIEKIMGAELETGFNIQFDDGRIELLTRDKIYVDLKHHNSTTR